MPTARVAAAAPVMAIWVAVYAVIVMALFSLWFLGVIAVPIALAPRAWFAHEALLAIVPALLAASLRTTSANATAAPSAREARSIMPAVLLVLWLLGRWAITRVDQVDARLTFAGCIALPLALSVQLVRGRMNPHAPAAAAALLAVLVAAETAFHVELWQTGRPRLAAAAIPAAVLCMHGYLAPRMKLAPASDRARPMLWMAEAFVALGMLLIGAGFVRDNPDAVAAGIQAWTTGALGAVIPAMMLGLAAEASPSAPQKPVPPKVKVLAWSMGIAAVVAGIAATCAAFDPGRTLVLLPVGACAWCLAFATAAAIIPIAARTR